jgi:hypothetical protein
MTSLWVWVDALPQIKICNNPEIKKNLFPKTKRPTNGPSNLTGARTGDRPFVTKKNAGKE